MTNLADPSSSTWPRARLALTLALAVYGLVILRDLSAYRLLDHVDLAIHEAGHVLFSPFGELVGFLGGTLLQLLVPIAFLGYFLRRGDPHAASVVLWWVAQNLWNVSVYVGDARAEELPLVGGGEHDWTYLLDAFGLLEKDHAVARGVVAAGLACYVGSIAWGLASLRTSSPTPPGGAPDPA